MCTRRQILDAADTLFGKDGFDATSIRDIAEFTGLNKSLIHYHYKSKDDLLNHLLDQYYEKLFQTLQRSLHTSGTFRERLTCLINNYFDFLAQHKSFSRIVQREASGGKHLERIQTHMLPFFNIGIAMIQQMYPATRTGSLRAEQLLISIYGMIVSYFSYSTVLEPLVGQNPLSEANLYNRKQHIQRMLNVILDALDDQENK